MQYEASDKENKHKQSIQRRNLQWLPGGIMGRHG